MVINLPQGVNSVLMLSAWFPSQENADQNGTLFAFSCTEKLSSSFSTIYSGLVLR